MGRVIRGLLSSLPFPRFLVSFSLDCFLSSQDREREQEVSSGVTISIARVPPSSVPSIFPNDTDISEEW
jgi:hypothetical protein